MLFEPAYKSPQYTGASWSAEIPWKIFFFLRKVPLFLFSRIFNFLSLCTPCSPAYNCQGGDVPGLIWSGLSLTPGLGYIALYCCVCNILCFILQQLSQYCNTEPFFFNLKQAVCIVSLIGGVLECPWNLRWTDEHKKVNIYCFVVTFSFVPIAEHNTRRWILLLCFVATFSFVQ